MHLTSEQKQRLQKYLQKKTRPGAILDSDMSNLLDFMADDLIQQMQKISHEVRSLDQKETQEIHDGIVSKLSFEGLQAVIKELQRTDNEIIKELVEIQDSEIFYNRLLQILKQNKDASKEFILGIITNYLALCTEFSFTPVKEADTILSQVNTK